MKHSHYMFFCHTFRGGSVGVAPPFSNMSSASPVLQHLLIVTDKKQFKRFFVWLKALRHLTRMGCVLQCVLHCHV